MKLTIYHTTGPRAGTSQSVTGKQVIKIGRRPDNDCVFNLDSDAKVSGYHAEVQVLEMRAIISDKGSTNGTFVNGKKIDTAELHPNDEIRLGADGPGFRIEYAAASLQPHPGSVAASGVPRSAPQALEQTAELSPPSGAAPPRPAAQSPTPAAEPAPASQPEPQQASQQPAEGKSSDKIYGQRTVGVMIQQALDAAGQEKSKGTSKSTEYFEALVDKKVKGTSSKLKWIVIASVSTLVLAGLILGIYLYNKPSTVIQTTQVNYGSAAGSQIASANRYNIFLIAGQPKNQPGSRLRGFCTGFAIRPDILATNAHCVRAAKEKFTNITALMNGAPSPSGRHEIARMVAHPGYRDGEISPDVGLMKLATPVSSTVTLAEPSELTQVAPGIDMFLYGFPGRLNKEEAPEATFIDGQIGRVTSFDQRLGDFNSNTLLQHSAYCTGGTSGSPMFNSAGHVIGINAGGYVENGQALPGYNFGMRIDLAYGLLSSIGSN